MFESISSHWAINIATLLAFKVRLFRLVPAQTLIPDFMTSIARSSADSVRELAMRIWAAIAHDHTPSLCPEHAQFFSGTVKKSLQSTPYRIYASNSIFIKTTITIPVQAATD